MSITIGPTHNRHQKETEHDATPSGNCPDTHSSNPTLRIRMMRAPWLDASNGWAPPVHISYSTTPNAHTSDFAAGGSVEGVRDGRAVHFCPYTATGSYHCMVFPRTAPEIDSTANLPQTWQTFRLSPASMEGGADVSVGLSSKLPKQARENTLQNADLDGA
jgi:hypothetical protein